ncbi:hypothetical protein NECAME_03493 [Necator americanus]|uniref:TACO1/YebC-like second and third domain-containing protein n=1 Tax=Necator americanus TaxID=51031 RepID=W2T2V4_NECAM|nr:hypothetical protein NECAME_03493 [Necator americanus]ETN76330.1 hypothetical protein NECAME_03493 [Necator americanus]
MMVNTKCAGAKKETRRAPILCNFFGSRKFQDATTFEILVPEVRILFIVGGFRLAAETSAVQSWFQRKGVVTVKAELKGKEVHLDQMEEIGIELDCEDVTLVVDKNPLFELLCEPGKLSDVESTLSSKGFVVESAEIQFRPRHPIHIAAEDASKVGKLYELLQEAEIFHEFHIPSSHSMYTLSRDTLQIFAVLQALVFSSGRNAEVMKHCAL